LEAATAAADFLGCAAEAAAPAAATGDLESGNDSVAVAFAAAALCAPEAAAVPERDGVGDDNEMEPLSSSDKDNECCSESFGAPSLAERPM
jgi:hypothetical protein